MKTDPRTDIVELIGEIFARRAAEAYIGEPVTIGEHMLQTARLAERDGADDATVAAALLHDVGHFTNDFPDDAADLGIDARHELAGAAFLAAHFPPSLTDCVRYHVDAKRFLCATETAYFDRLSAASVHSLRLQGGPMSDDEAELFVARPHWRAVVQVRRWDDEAKVPGAPTRRFADYAPLLRSLLREA